MTIVKKSRPRKAVTRSHDRVVFMADAHLDAGTYAGRPDIRYDSVMATDFIVDWCIENDVQAIVAAGDIIDSRKPPAYVCGRIRRWMDKLREDNIKFRFIQGQHDLSDPPWLSSIHPWPFPLGKFPLRSSGRTIFGMDWQPADLLEERLKHLFATNRPSPDDILVMHQVWEDLMGGIRGCEGSFSMIPTVRTLVTGDYHETLKIDTIGADNQQLTVYSPGSTNMRKIDEPPNKFFYFWDTSKHPEPRMIQIPTRPYLEYHIKSEDEFDTFNDNIQRHVSECEDEARDNRGVSPLLCKPLVRVIYDEEIPKVAARINSAVGDLGHLFLKVWSKSVDGEDDSPSIEFSQGGLTSYLESIVPREDDRYQPLLRLLSTDDPRIELEAMRKDRFASPVGDKQPVATTKKGG